MTVARGPPGRPSSSALLGCWRRRPPLGFGVKVAIAMVLGLSFAVLWTSLSRTSASQQISTERSSFAADIAAPPPASNNRTTTGTSGGRGGHTHRKPRPAPHGHKKRHPSPSRSHSHPHSPNGTASPDAAAARTKADHAEPAPVIDQEVQEPKEPEQEPEPDTDMEPEQEAELPMPEESDDNGGKAPAEEEEKSPELELEDESNEGDGKEEDPEAAKRKAANKRRKLPPLFSPGAHYHWKHCSAKSGHHYIPCVDFDGDGSQRHHERSCPRSPVTCLVSLPKEYKQPAPWPERKDKVWKQWNLA